MARMLVVYYCAVNYIITSWFLAVRLVWSGFPPNYHNKIPAHSRQV